MIAILFWTFASLVFYCYAVYPVLVACLSRAFGRSGTGPSSDPDPWPEVTLLIAAYNEEAVIEERIRNALAMDYPVDRLRIVIGLDGCSDDTAAIVRRFEGPRVRVIEFSATRQGHGAE